MGKTYEKRSPKDRFFRFLLICLIGLVIHLWILLGAMIFGHPFVPSENYVSSHDTLAKSVGVTTGIILLALIYKKVSKDFQTPESSLKIFFKAAFGLVALPLLVGFFFRAFILTAYPLWSALLAGANTQLEFSVYDADGSSSRCSHQVDLDMPFLTGTFCGVSEDLRKILKRGTRVVVSGRGTSDGLFASRIELPG